MCKHNLQKDSINKISPPSNQNIIVNHNTLEIFNIFCTKHNIQKKKDPIGRTIPQILNTLFPDIKTLESFKLTRDLFATFRNFLYSHSQEKLQKDIQERPDGFIDYWLNKKMWGDVDKKTSISKKQDNIDNTENKEKSSERNQIPKTSETTPLTP